MNAALAGKLERALQGTQGQISLNQGKEIINSRPDIYLYTYCILQLELYLQFLFKLFFFKDIRRILKIKIKKNHVSAILFFSGRPIQIVHKGWRGEGKT